MFSPVLLAKTDIVVNITTTISTLYIPHSQIRILLITKTEFLLIGRAQQLSKLTSRSLPLTSDICLTPVHFARNIGFIVYS